MGFLLKQKRFKKFILPGIYSIFNKRETEDYKIYLINQK